MKNDDEDENEERKNKTTTENVTIYLTKHHYLFAICLFILNLYLKSKLILLYPLSKLLNYRRTTSRRQVLFKLIVKERK